MGYGKNYRKGVHEVCVGEGKWITHDEWEKAISARKGGYATKQQEEWLDYGHWKA